MRHGKPEKYVLSALPGQVNVRTAPHRGHYLALPIPDVLLGHCRGRGSTSVYVTGFRVEGDLFHRAPMDMFAVCVSMPPGPLPAIPLIDAGKPLEFHFPVGNYVMDTKKEADLWTMEDTYPEAVCQAAFTEKARDKSYFQAPMRAGISPRGNASFSGGKKTTSHRGRASVTFSRKGEPLSTSSADRYVKESFRLWWDVGAKLTVCDSTGAASGSQYALLIGLRPQVDVSLPGKEQSEVVASLNDLRVTLYFRQ